MTSTTRLPADFTSLYRLFLRATGASVLNKGYPTQRLRRLWRPSFESAAQVVHRLQGALLQESERASLQRWYRMWEIRSKRLNLIRLNDDIHAPAISSGQHADVVVHFCSNPRPFAPHDS